jgi:enoyl-CoA hydratase/carnithine racemase
VSHSHLIVTRKGRVGTLVLNRPQKRNALSKALARDLASALEDLAGDDTLRTVLIRGAGERDFCSGYDIGELPVGSSGPPGRRLARLRPVEEAFQQVIRFPYPVVAVINGAAFGAGCELALCCDLRLAADDVRMGMPPARLGLVYPWWGLLRFVQTVGLSVTRELFYTARPLSGPRLFERGLVDRLLPRERLDEVAADLAAAIAANAPLALKGTKRVLNLLAGAAPLSEAAAREAEELAENALASEDLQATREAFLKKETPVFRGR